MAINYASHVSPKITPQTEPIPGKPMVANSAGGYSFEVSDWTRLDRFLILGAEGGTYYIKERELTQENAQAVIRCLQSDAIRTINQIVAVSDSGRAPKNDPAIFALALATVHTKPEQRPLVYESLRKVCRTGTHLFQFVAAVDALRGWGSGLRKAVGSWYLSQTPEDLAYQITKYQQRNGWSHKDVLRLASPTPSSAVYDAIFRWVISGLDGMGERTVTRGKGDKAVTKKYPAVSQEQLPSSIAALEALKSATTPQDVVNLIEQYQDKAPRELIPTQFLSDPKVWGAMLPYMPITATLRNLGTMTRNGLLTPLSDAVKMVCDRIRDPNRIKKGRVHPLAILIALKTYQQGHGVKSQGEGWTAIQPIVDALNDAFYLAFDAVEPSGKRWLFGLDVSRSMSSPVSGAPISCCEAATALALVSTRVEPYTFTGRFNMGFEPVPFGNSTRLDAAMRYTRDINGGGTDCALPMLYALQNKIPVDVFCALTDSETWGGQIHPVQALNEYRQRTGIGAKLIVVGMTSSGFTIADPNDGGMLDVVGLDTSVPAVMSDFAKN